MNLFADKKAIAANEVLCKKLESLLFKDSDDSKKALEYLNKRGFTEELIKTYRVGWCPQEKVIKDKNREFMCGGITFPIINEYDEIIAFSRRLPEDKKNLAENVLPWFNESYPKTYYLYGLNVAIEHILKNKSVFIVEGQCDATSCHRHGLKNVVATMGTALTKDHLIKLSRFTNTIILMFDADKAGREATTRSIELIKSINKTYYNIYDINLNVKGIEYDPDEFLNFFGPIYIVKHLKKLKEMENEEARVSDCI